MNDQPKWIATSVTVAGAVLAAGGAIWGLTSTEVGEGNTYIQQLMSLVGAVIAFYGRLRAKSQVTLLPK